MLAIARSDLIQLFRNQLVLVTGLIIPVVVSTFFVYRHEIFAEAASLGYIAAIVTFKRILPGGSATELVVKPGTEASPSRTP